MITVVGLGLREDSVSLRGHQRIKTADKVILRTSKTPPAKNYAFDSLDYLYDKADNFDELNEMIVSELLKRSEKCDLVYCVDGDAYKDSSVVELSKHIDFEIIPAAFDLMIPPSTSCVYVSAYEVAMGFYPDPKVPICVYNIDDANMASEVKLFLLRFFDAEQEVLLVTAKNKKSISLMELDRQKSYSFDTAVYVEGGFNASFADLLRIMARLTAPDGCPWDKAQTHESIRINLLEEAYETVQAITDGNIEGMIEELGDVLLQVVFHADIAFRCGEFTLEDILKTLNDKLIGRHTHIFGGDKAEGADGALSVWERNKMKEKHQDTFSAAVNDVPECFPALLRAQKVVKRVEKGGWGRKTIDGIRAKLSEELDELNMAFESGDKQALAEELGDVLFSIAWLGHRMGGNCEQALLDTVVKVQRRYTSFEQAVLADGKDVNKLTDEEWRLYYDKAKNQ